LNGCLEINRRIIGTGRPVYVVAELSANHNKNFDEAVKLIHAARAAGADAVKVQTYTADTLTIKSYKPFFKIHDGMPWQGLSLYDLYNEASMPWDWQPKLKVIANDLGLDFFSTAFDSSAVDFLEEIDVPVHKIASFEIVDLQLIKKMAETGKPLIISTGMATLKEINEALETAKKAGAAAVALLKCTSSYPAPITEANLRTIPALIKKFCLPVGISDHTLGSAVVNASVALGASIVEKHFTLSRKAKGLDSSFSMEPSEFKSMVNSIRTIEAALGQIHFGPSKSEIGSKSFRRSLFVVKDIKKGETFTLSNIHSIRPANGLPPKFLCDIIGRQAAKDIERGTPFSWDLVS
jgi:pseudaminic acid synthase